MSNQPHSHAVHVIGTPPLASAASADGIAAITGPGLGLVLRERIRQVEHHGFTPAHDRQHDANEIALGALSFVSAGLALTFGQDASNPKSAVLALGLDDVRDGAWPFSDELLPPADPVDCYAKAAAMLLAEIDRLLGGTTVEPAP